jgi:hypothetical protein
MQCVIRITDYRNLELEPMHRSPHPQPVGTGLGQQQQRSGPSMGGREVLGDLPVGDHADVKRVRR